jgi:hypothetical protein
MFGTTFFPNMAIGFGAFCSTTLVLPGQLEQIGTLLADKG